MADQAEGLPSFPLLRKALEDHMQNAKAKSALDTIKEAA